MSDWLIFEDEVYTTSDVAQQIEANIAKKNIPPELGDLLRLPHYGAVAEMPVLPEDRPELAPLFQHLKQANLLYKGFQTEPDLSDSAATNVPLLGSLWQRIRGGAHQLVLFYVNRYGSQQNELNSHLISILNQVVEENIVLRRQIDRLEKQLTEKQED